MTLLLLARAHWRVVLVMVVALAVGLVLGRGCPRQPVVVVLPDPGSAAAVQDAADEAVEAYETRQDERQDRPTTAGELDGALR